MSIYPTNPDWPTNYQGCTITGRYIDAAGNPVSGYVHFTPSPKALLNADEDVIIVGKKITVELDASGAFSVTLPASDDPDINPTGWTYSVVEEFSGGRTYSIEAPQNTVIDLADVAPVASGTGTTITRGVAGDPGAPGSVEALTTYKYVDGELVSNFQAGHGWTLTNASDSTESFVRGTQSVAMTHPGTVAKTGMPAFSLTNKALRIQMRLVNRLDMDNIKVYVGDTNLTNTYEFRANPRNTATQSIGVEGEWFTFTLAWSDVYRAHGTRTLTNYIPNNTTGFTDVRVELSGPGSVAYLQSIEIIDAPKAEFPNGVVTIGFDDGWVSQRLGFAAMEARGIRGTNFLIADNVGTGGRLNHDDYKRNLVNGWEVAGHSYTQAKHDDRYINFTAAEVEAECANLRAFLYDNGYDGTSFAYPGGEFDVTTDGVLVGDIVRQYFGAGRSILFSTGVAEHFVSDTLPPAMAFRIRCISGIAENKPATSVDNPFYITQAGGVLDRTASAGTWLNLLFHEVIPGVSTNGLRVGIAAFEQILDGIQDRGMAVMPMNEVLGRYKV